MIVEKMPEHFYQDIDHAFGGSGEAWLDYSALIIRLTPEVDAGRYPTIGADDVSVLRGLPERLQLDVPMEFKMALQRLTIDKDYYGSALVGMGDLLAIRSIESYVRERVDYKVSEKLAGEPLLRKVVLSIRRNGHSKGAPNDIALAKRGISFCLADIAAMAVTQNGNITSTDIERFAEKNDIDARRIYDDCH